MSLEAKLQQGGKVHYRPQLRPVLQLTPTENGDTGHKPVSVF